MSFRFSPAARADLRSIWLYTKKTWSSAQADHYILSIEATCEALASGTMRGQSADHYRHGYMRATVGSHYVFYTVSSSRSIDIIRILHQRMDIPSHLTDDNR